MVILQMRKLIPLILAFIASVVSHKRHLYGIIGQVKETGVMTPAAKIVCYFGSWAVYRYGNGKYEIPLTQSNLCTHFIYTFTGLGPDGTIISLDPYADYDLNGFGQVNALKQRNPDLKVLIAMGGWNEGSAKYSKAVSTEKGRVKLANSILIYVKQYGFDGFDLDWEYPNQRGGVPADKENLILFLKELKHRFSAENLLLTIAVGATEAMTSLSYKISEVAALVDFINLMTYDYHGSGWENVLGHVAPLYSSPSEPAERAKNNVNVSVHHWISNGAPSEKIILGMPFYGQSFRLADQSKTQMMSPSAGPGNAGKYTSQPGSLSYLELCELFSENGWVHEFEEHQRVPYSYRGDQWVGYDNVRSLTEKAEYVKSMNLGGAMTWSIESDDFRGVSGESFPLLKALNSVLRGGEAPATPVSTLNPQITTKVDSPSTIIEGDFSSTPAHTIKPWSTTEVEPPPTIIEGVCTNEEFIRDEKDCGKFYRCEKSGNGFIMHDFQCPAGLHFDLKLNICNYPSEVNCEN